MARPTRKESIYTVSIHNNGGYRYASTHPYTVTEDGKRKYRIVHWGTVTDDLRFIPGKNYRQASEEERARLIFPKEWNLSEITPEEDDGMNHLYGDIWLLEHIARHLDLYKYLEDAFGFDTSVIDDIMTLAFYPCVSDRGFSMVSSWQHIVKAPSKGLLEEDRINSILKRIKHDGVENLMRLMRDRYSNDRTCVVDSICKSAYGESLADLRWGRKKERIHLRMTVNAVVYSIENGLPLYFLPLEKTTSDSRGITDIIEAVQNEGIDDPILITDRAYDSIHNLTPFIAEGRKMVMCTNVRQKFILDRIPENSEVGDRPEGMVYNAGIRRFVRQYGLKNGLKLNLFFNPTRRLDELSGLEREIASQRMALETMILTKEHMDDDKTLRQSYWWFNIEYDETNRTIISYSPNERRIETARRTSGFYANVTSDLEMSPVEAMNVYGLKYDQERSYDKMIGQMDLMSAADEEYKEGWRLILYLSMLLTSSMGYIWRRCSSLKESFRSPSSILDELRSLRWSDASSYEDIENDLTDFWKRLSTRQKMIVRELSDLRDQLQR